ncbi:Oidioi.mRNA.OKI2018_I69.XSR.g16998.t2.cds [Oikopleura dioica]|uniref:NADPH--hemoprotein reductase n=1 Tax=Oikopleura dioica TaxID=34765 RepID=A0ABN7SN15_OIKDI|nr:Oidioi.mRNA.OKI2018_I69.XSR.g16998.t2.cds [Oikopleura dioica]
MRKIEFDLKPPRGVQYEAGDHIAVYASNNPVDVDKLCKLLGVDGEETFSLENVDEDSSKKYPFPCPTTYRTALTHYVDIHGQPRANLLAELVQYTPPQSESRLMLEKLCGIHGQDPAEAKKLYQEWVLDQRRTIHHILEDLTEVKIAADHLLELLPRLQPRYYSIASSPKHDSTRVAICAILVQYKASKERINTGVATGFMKNKVPTEGADLPPPTLPVFIRRSQFKLPFRTTTPIIMIGPGTGFAPFRGFLQHRQWQRLSDKREVGQTVLFTGCRNREVDYIYSEELESFEKDGTIDKLFCAFSRDSEKKVYVQHLLAEQRELVWDVINRNGHIYVCGDAKNMARDVNEVILDIISEFKKVPKSAAQDFLKSMRNKGRYQEDVWS